MTNDIAGEGADVGSEVGTLLAGRYRVEALIGHGGMAMVYRARDEALGRTVALKVFNASLADAEDLRRQDEEIRLIARLNHFALVTLFDAVTDNADGGTGQSLIVMQYVHGTDLRQRLLRGVLDPRTVAMLGADVAEALAYVHSHSVVHRDVKPANILLPDRESEATGPRAMLADFGIARIVDGTRLTATGSVLGTANYLSPEQAVGGTLSPATDVYSLGLVLVECLTGERCFPGSALESVSARLARDPEIPLQFGEAWHKLLKVMTLRDPAERITAASAAIALRDLALTAAAAPLNENPEQLAVTLKYPATRTRSSASELPTVVLGAQSDVEPRLRRTPAAPSLPSGSPPMTLRRQRPSRRAAIVSVLAILALILGFGTWATVAASQGSRPPSEPAQVSYPPVGGQLGVHLRQLQTTVKP